ncbi:MAG: hypothetical protein A3G29_10840 [Burkholderiales bacterium RIFCSPLOWO2_12_FULL_64_99]|nr:MAG: hypothetical protein A3E52_14340 [Burkholderiales bacterium RIFCSPHIGHO2_12_FULL_63_20]OGB62450.1 MAG: hypothetical protein A3G29_10840 [Burkholderiales bacterium RIFCSPLOWO2_12_FULL_64_99]
MALITDKGMQASATDADQWLTEGLAKGNGAFLGRITRGGLRTFYYRYKGTTGQVRLPIGPFSAKGDGHSSFTVAQARARALAWSALRREKGIVDLREYLENTQKLEQERLNEELRQQQAAIEQAKQESQRLLSVNQLFERWRTTSLQPRIGADGRREGRKDGGKLAQQQFDRYVSPKIGTTLLRDLTRADLIGLLDEQRSAGRHRTAQMMWADMRQMLTFALDRQLINSDPLSGVEKARIVGKATERDRFLTEAELSLLDKQILASGLAFRSSCAIWLTLATGVRVGELVGAIWSTALPDSPLERTQRISALQDVANLDGAKIGIVDQDSRTWYLPDTKNQRDHSVHLSDFALKVLKQLCQVREHLKDGDPGELSPWIFPGENNRLPIKRASIGKQIADRQKDQGSRLKQRTKAHDSLRLPGGHWTMHDLRRTTGTMMAELGVSGDVIDECLNHVIESNVRRRYVRTRRLDDQRKAFDLIGSKLTSIVTAT